MIIVCYVFNVYLYNKYYVIIVIICCLLCASQYKFHFSHESIFEVHFLKGIELSYFIEAYC
jgi:hypothetical protein